MADAHLYYATRYGSTRRLAEALASGADAHDVKIVLHDVATAPDPAEVPAIVLTAVIWDRPLPAMRTWLARHGATVAPRLLAAGVVCGSAGVREGGGMSYARGLLKRIGRPDGRRFALAGEIPARDRVGRLSWWALKLFAAAMRKPQLFTVRADLAAARAQGEALAARLRQTASA